MEKTLKKSTILEEKQQVTVQSNSELVTTKSPNAGISLFNKCLKVNLQKFYAHHILTKEEASIT